MSEYAEIRPSTPGYVPMRPGTLQYARVCRPSTLERNYHQYAPVSLGRKHDSAIHPVMSSRAWDTTSFQLKPLTRRQSGSPQQDEMESFSRSHVSRMGTVSHQRSRCCHRGAAVKLWNWARDPPGQKFMPGCRDSAGPCAVRDISVKVLQRC